MESARIRLEPAASEGDDLVLAATLEHPDAGTLRLWWRLPAAWADAVTPWADPFVAGFLFPMMQWGRDVRVEGPVSPSLLANLETYMAIWHAWAPERYRPVQIQAAEEVEAPPPAEPGQTVMPFSCGIDSSFTLLRHHRGLAGRRSRRLGAGVVMHGFDIPLDRKDSAKIYADLLADARFVLDSAGVPCVPLAGNYRQLPVDRHDSHGMQLVSGLRLLARRFDTALIANTTPYALLSARSGTHPVCDPLLSSRHFRVIDDGAEAGRVAKAEMVSQWPQAVSRLHACRSNPAGQTNCCRCEKCMRTILAFRAAGCSVPPTLSEEPTVREIRRVHLSRALPLHLHTWREIAREARLRGLGRTAWAKAVRSAIRRTRLRWFVQDLKRPFLPLRNRLRTFFRGSPLSRAQLAGQAGAPAVPAEDPIPPEK